MGKLDDIRRQREQQFAEQQSAAPARAVKPTPGEEAVTTTGRPTVAGRRRAVEEGEAKCAVCGKLRPLNHGLLADHQKGLGKFCGGSRQKPA